MGTAQTLSAKGGCPKASAFCADWISCRFLDLSRRKWRLFLFFLYQKNRYFYDYLNDFFVENDYFLNGAHLYDSGK